MLAAIVVVAFWGIAAFLRLLERQMTLASLALERTIARIHSIVYTLLDAIASHVLTLRSSAPRTVLMSSSAKTSGDTTSGPTVQTDTSAQHRRRRSRVADTLTKASLSDWPRDAWQQRKTSSRAYWDPSKGSAIVLWSAGNQAFAHSLALSLASQRSRRRPTRAGQPPYTVIVIVPSATQGLTGLIGAWARAKATATQDGIKQRRETSGSSDTSSSDSIEQERASHDATQPTKSKHSPASARDTSSKTGKHRRLSIGGWSAGDVVGYGFDMLKGLRVGQEDVTRGIGAIIPIVADTSTSSGIAYAQSTIQDYCISHDLLLRGLIVVPSTMTIGERSRKSATERRSPNSSEEHIELQNSPATSARTRTITPPKNPTLAAQALTRMAENSSALDSDLKEIILVVAALHASLQTDGGRIIGLIPSAWQGHDAYDVLLNAAQESEAFCTSSDMSLRRGHKARSVLSKADRKGGPVPCSVAETWNQVDRTLQAHGGGVSVSRVSMAPVLESNRALSPATDATGSQKGSGTWDKLHGTLTSLAALVHPLLYPTEPSPYALAMSQFQRAAAGAGAEDEDGNGILDRFLPVHSRRRDMEKDERSRGDDDVTMPSASQVPPLLTQAIRSLLARSVPRKHACIGLGPRLEDVWSHVPGHSLAQHYLSQLFS